MSVPTTDPAPADGATEPAVVTPKNLEAELAWRGIHGPDYGLLQHAGPLRDDLDTDAISPVHPGNPNFDWATVFADLDGPESEPTLNAMGDETTRRAAYAMAALVLRRLIDWVLDVKPRDGRAVKAVGIRAFAAAWVIDPGRFGEDASLSRVARQLGFHGGNSLSPESAEFSRCFGITNHFQAHCHDKEKCYAKN